MIAPLNEIASSNASADTMRHAGPHLGIVAIVYALLFNAGLYSVTVLAGKTHWPGPWESGEVIVAYFQAHAAAVLTCAFLQIGATIALGIFAATAVSRMHFLGVRAAGPYIALLGGFLTVVDGLAAGFVVWTMVHPGIAQDATLVRALYYLSYAFGGSGFSMPMGLLLAGICVPAAFLKLLPKLLVIFGLALAV